MTTNLYELPITCYQASELIRRCFEHFKRMNIRQLSGDKIQKLGKHLVDSSMIDHDLFREALQNSKGNRAHLLDAIRGLIGRENFRSCDILLEWMEKNGYRLDSKDLERRDRQYCLENMVRIEDKALSTAEIQERLEMYARAERFLPGNETANANCMYQALYRAIDKPSILPSDYFGLKSALTYEYMTKHKPKQYLVDLDDIEPSISKNWLGFVSYLQQKSHPGHPLVLFAAALKYNFVIHVTSMAALEEFALYPENRIVHDGELHHVYIVHIQKQHYMSVIRIKDPRPFTYEELQMQLNQKTGQISELKISLNKSRNELKFKETQMMNRIKKLEDEKQVLTQSVEQKETEIQNLTQEKEEKVRKLENKVQKLRDEVKTLKTQQEENKRENTQLMDDIKRERQNTLERQGEQIRELYKIIGEQSRSFEQPRVHQEFEIPELHLDFTGASSEQIGISDVMNQSLQIDTNRSQQSRTFIKSSSLNRRYPQAHGPTRQNTRMTGVQSEPTSRRNSLGDKRPRSESNNVRSSSENDDVNIQVDNFYISQRDRNSVQGNAEEIQTAVMSNTEVSEGSRQVEHLRQKSRSSTKSDISRTSLVDVMEESEEI